MAAGSIGPASGLASVCGFGGTGVAEDFYVRFWGVRGSLPCPGTQTIRYGGNTSCVELRCGDRLFILDAGSGIRELGRTLGQDGPVSADIFISHVHYDHIIGFPFFRPAYLPQNRFRIWAARFDMGIEAIFHQFMSPPLFPISIDVMRSGLEFRDFQVGDTLRPAPDVEVRTVLLNHPNGAAGYRFDYRGRAICYVTDTEHRPEGPDQGIVELIRGADIVIYDATYTDEDYPGHEGWGHSTWQQGLELCRLAGAGTYVPFHHDPSHDDDFLERVASELTRAQAGAIVAHEGLILRP